MNIPHILKPSLAVLTLGSLAPMSALALQFDQNVSPDVIFGSGNANGGFTVDSANGVELGLRGKLRYNAAGDPENTFNSNGDGTYSFSAGIAPGQLHPTPEWSFEWSINSAVDGPLRALSALTYELGVDMDPTLGTNFFTSDPINTFWADHALGNNSTANGAGIETPLLDISAYSSNIDEFNVAQNSWQPHFWFINPAFDPTIEGTYDFYLSAFDDAGGQLARTDIQIIVGNGGSAVPDGGSALLLLSAGLLGLFGYRRLAKRHS